MKLSDSSVVFHVSKVELKVAVENENDYHLESIDWHKKKRKHKIDKFDHTYTQSSQYDHANNKNKDNDQQEEHKAVLVE
jgi:hypothetical protein